MDVQSGKRAQEFRAAVELTWKRDRAGDVLGRRDWGVVVRHRC